MFSSLVSEKLTISLAREAPRKRPCSAHCIGALRVAASVVGALLRLRSVLHAVQLKRWAKNALLFSSLLSTFSAPRSTYSVQCSDNGLNPLPKKLSANVAITVQLPVKIVAITRTPGFRAKASPPR